MLAQVLGRDRQRIDKPLLLPHPEAVAVKVRQQPLVRVGDERLGEVQATGQHLPVLRAELRAELAAPGRIAHHRRGVADHEDLGVSRQREVRVYGHTADPVAHDSRPGLKKRACCDIASHAPRLMAVCNDYLRVGVVPAESHLESENKARIAFLDRKSVV